MGRECAYAEVLKALKQSDLVEKLLKAVGGLLCVSVGKVSHPCFYRFIAMFAL